MSATSIRRKGAARTCGFITADFAIIWRTKAFIKVQGGEEILQKTGTVAEARERIICVRARNEMWNAESADKLRSGDNVKIVGREGLMWQVK